MGDNTTQKILTREDLLYILSAIFRLSREPNNAFKMLDDGLYVQDITEHEQNTNLHIEERIRNILDNLTVDDSGNLYYNDYLISRISKKEGNAIKQLEDGIYIEDVFDETKEHLKNEDIHVTIYQKETWNNALKLAKEYAYNLYDSLVIMDYEVVTELPTENIISSRIYLLTANIDKPDEMDAIPYVYVADKWYKLGITNETLNNIFTDTEKTLENYVLKKDYHNHNNKSVLDKLSETEDGVILFNGDDLRRVYVSDEPNNAIKLIDGKLFVKDFEKIIHQLQVSSAFSKDVLYNKECTDSGPYDLEYPIDDYSVLLIDYYYKPNDPEQSPGNAKSVMVDVDTLNVLYDKGIDYMLELGYGISVCNSKIRMHDTKLYVNYYHNVCIYKITGIRKSGGE